MLHSLMLAYFQRDNVYMCRNGLEKSQKGSGERAQWGKVCAAQ